MCGIAGFSLSPNSTINVRQLSNELFKAIEDRGYMASGFAWQTKNKMGVHKAAVTGSKLPLSGMPLETRNAILHTRLATHGATSDNRNNHPVMSPNDNIALVHNGVIYNHTEVRRKVTGVLPPVDTSVIPAVLEEHGIESINLLNGDAAIAWFDRNDQGTMHLARYQHSPLVMCQVEDGSFIFCSTEALLWRTLIALNIMPTWMQTANELDYFTIRNGIIASKAMLPEPQYSESYYDYNYYRHQTSGAKGKALGTTARSVYADDWDKEDWENAYGYADYPVNKRAWYALDDEDDDDYTVDTCDLTEQVSYYTTILHTVLDKEEDLFYVESEKELWKNELFYLAQENEVELVDYGFVLGITSDSVDKVSTKEDVM